MMKLTETGIEKLREESAESLLKDMERRFSGDHAAVLQCVFENAAAAEEARLIGDIVRRTNAEFGVSEELRRLL